MLGARTPLHLAAAMLFLAVCVDAQTQQPARMYRVGFLTLLAASPEPPTLRAFRQGLKELGYEEGKNVVIDARFGAGREDRLPQLVAEILAGKPDVFLAGSDLGALAAKNASSTIPIVFAGVSDPVDKGIVASLSRPEGNITGITVGIGGSGLGGKWVQVLREAIPGISRVAVLHNSASPIGAPYVREVQAAARTLNVKIDVFDAGTTASLEKTLAAIRASGVQGLVVVNDPFFVANRAKVVEFAAAARVPAMYFFKIFADDGGLMAYGPSLEDSYRRAALYVDKILKGAQPVELPIELPTRFELTVNRRAANALGLVIPQALLLRADYIIE
jgi:putative ABC transport system substrate-binding protein